MGKSLLHPSEPNMSFQPHSGSCAWSFDGVWITPLDPTNSYSLIPSLPPWIYNTVQYCILLSLGQLPAHAFNLYA